MPDKEIAWALRPVEAGMCRYESLKDGTLTIDDVAAMNDYLDVKHANQAKFNSWASRQHRGK